MKLLLGVACLLLVSSALCYSVAEDDTPACNEVFSAQVCDDFDQIDVDMADELDRARRQLPPGPDPNPDPTKQLLEELLKKKIQFILNLGFLKNVPFIGQMIHDLVANDPDGVAKALAGNIFDIIKLVLSRVNIG
ncbi:uncharacterized protein LOC130627658 [Hydractinia symbiolongicarpus]|uniref:uncharacterized protein LOC130627658 n=1 Tax=Hydractinia symbiolongicarpus TaxID=13093 RepID=UPI00254B5724|nr:uncharacterized protein LOC130627658 [Hydractinia symbiolongicarpus]